MRKKYKIKVTKKLIEQLRPFWREFRKVQGRYDIKLRKLEEGMAKKTGIKNIEFFFFEVFNYFCNSFFYVFFRRSQDFYYDFGLYFVHFLSIEAIVIKAKAPA